MLKKENRLPLRTFRKEKTYFSPFFTVHIANTSPSQPAQIGFIVTKRVDKRAVVRNRIKRQLRACLEESLETIRPGYGLLFTLKKEALTAPKDTLCAEVQTFFKRADIETSL